MFSSQSIDYSLSTPARCLASLPPRSSSSAAAKPNSDDEQDGWGDDDSFQFDDANTHDTHRFLVGTAIPSITKPDGENDLSNDDENNQLHLLTYHEDSHEITLDASYPHNTGEIWALAPHPKNDTLVTCGGGVYLESGNDGASSNNQLMEFKTQLWKISDGDEEGFGLGPSLESLIVIPHGENNNVDQNAGWEKRVGCILWNPILSSDDPFEDREMGGGSLLTVGWEAVSPISLWDLSASVAVETWSSSTSSSNRRKRYNLQSALPRRASWDPHQTTTILCTEVQDVIAYDTRMPSGTSGVGVIRNAHRYGVTDVDHNRLQEHVVVTSGMDGVVKFWDLRMHLSFKEENSSLPPANLLKVVRGGHSHWTTRASYNPFHDQLVISGGTDGIANLWRISSCSSAPLLDFDGDDDVNNGGEDPLEEEGGDEIVDGNWGKEEGEEEINPVENDYNRGEEKKDSSSTKPPSNDIRVSRYECSDTTADVCWNVSDPWIYASLSCDGAFVVHHVPSKEKYKILL